MASSKPSMTTSKPSMTTSKPSMTTAPSEWMTLEGKGAEPGRTKSSLIKSTTKILSRYQTNTKMQEKYKFHENVHIF
jgi:hypothetical protein